MGARLFFRGAAKKLTQEILDYSSESSDIWASCWEPFKAAPKLEDLAAKAAAALESLKSNSPLVTT